MNDFLFYILLDRARPEKRHATSSGAVVTSRNNKIARSVHPPGCPPPPSARLPSRTPDRAPRPRKVPQVARATLARFSSRKSDPAGAVKFSRLAPHPAGLSRATPTHTPSASYFAAKHSGGHAGRKLFQNSGAAPHLREVVAT